ncbi:MAG: hypothetical protein LKE30_05390 [Bacteroidales bacterium]|jgi:hypothetical protein|nr:hypothetical protein [Bacteroidales bacterium]
MKKSNIILVAIVMISTIIGCTSCKSIQESTFHSDYQNPNLLPRLTCWIDQPSFENAYGANSYSVKPSNDLEHPYGLTETPYGKGVYEVTDKTKLYTAEKRIQDAANILVYDVNENICDPTTRRAGNIVLRAGNIYCKNNYKWSWLSGFTLGIFNAMGMTMCSNTTELEVIVEIYDTRNNLVAKFNERGYSKQQMAAYHGYYEFQRRAGALALEDGLMKIKELINRDYNMINAKLK